MDFDKINIDSVAYNVKDTTARQQIDQQWQQIDQQGQQITRQGQKITQQGQQITQQGQQITQQGQSIQKLLETLPSFINVKNYIQNNELDFTGIPDGPMYIPKGTWQVTSNQSVTGRIIVADSDATIISAPTAKVTFIDCTVINATFSGSDGIIARGSSMFVSCTFGASNFQTIGNKIQLEFIGNSLTIKNCTFNGASKAQFCIWSDDATQGSSTRIWVDDSIFKGAYLNAIFTSAPFCRVCNCTFSGNHVQTSPNGGGQIDFKHRYYNEQWTVENCQFFDPKDASSGVEVEGGNYSQITVKNCYIQSVTGAYPIAVLGTCYLLSIGNKMSGGSAGILLKENTSRAICIGDYNAVTPKFTNSAIVNEITWKS